MKKTLKIFSTLFICGLLVLSLASCFSLNSVTSLKVVKGPKTSYALNEKVNAKEFSVDAVVDGQIVSMNLTDDRLTVQGLDGDRLDTSSIGEKTVTISYGGISIVLTYEVTGQAAITYWKNNTVMVEGSDVTITEPGQLAYIAANPATFATATIKLEADLDLSAHYWNPIVDFAGTFDGQGHTISGLKADETCAAPADNTGLGLFTRVKGGIYQNVVIDGTSIYAPNQKQVSCLLGSANGGNIIIENVVVNNASLTGLSCVAGLIGRTASATSITIKGCYVEGAFSATNPVSAATADGEGDKVAGLAGQLQDNATISDCSVKVVVNGTRDLAGLVGYIGANTTITNCQVLKGTVIAASVSGGMELAKGTRNIGGLVGTVASTLTFSSCNAEDVELSLNSMYGFSSAGKYVGGVRGGQDATINGTNWTKMYPKTNQEDYFNAQKAFLASINA